MTSPLLSQTILFDGQPTSIGAAIATLQSEGTPQHLVDRWLQGTLLAQSLQAERS